MLYSIDKVQMIKKVAHERELTLIKSKLTDTELENIIRTFNEMANKSDFLTSSWLPGTDLDGHSFSVYISCL